MGLPRTQVVRHDCQAAEIHIDLGVFSAWRVPPGLFVGCLLGTVMHMRIADVLPRHYSKPGGTHYDRSTIIVMPIERLKGSRGLLRTLGSLALTAEDPIIFPGISAPTSSMRNPGLLPAGSLEKAS